LHHARTGGAKALDEPYRSPLGHPRHKIGHYYWQALARYHRDGPPSDWALTHASAYATSHPWEDFADSFAHYLHIVDTLEMAAYFGVRLRPVLPGPEARAMAAELKFDPISAGDFTAIIDAWLKPTDVANNLKRCMGSADLCPCTLSETVIGKLGLIHALVGERRAGL